MHMRSLVTAAVLLAASAAPAGAATRIQSGIGPGGAAWTATSYVVGQTSTGSTPPRGTPNTVPGGGGAMYLAPNSAGYSGVVGLLMTLDSGSRFVCSGSLVGDRSVVTAGHCVSHGGGVKANDIVRTQVFFQDDASSALDERVFGIPTGNLPPGVTMIDVSTYAISSTYTGEVVDQNDIAVLTLADVAPAYARRYELYTEDLTGKQFNVTGYGARSSVGGAEGTTPLAAASNGYRRQGDNVFDYAWGNEAFGGFFTDRSADGWTFFGTAEVGYSFVADFDDGMAAQDASCRVAQFYRGVSAADADALGFCTTGVGAGDVSIASGDSGGGAFIHGRLASVNSYGLSFDPDHGLSDDFDTRFGTLTGYVPIFIHADFIRNAIVAVPEPATWAQMLLGFGLIGVATRRRRSAAVDVCGRASAST